MSREFKFRSWLKFENKMLYDFGILYNGEVSETSKRVVMQFTGLKDKHGTEIFEGDIIYWEINNGVGIESYTAIVKWSENLVEEGWSQTYK